MERNDKIQFEDLCAQIPELDYTAGLTTCCGDKDFYLELFHDFVELGIEEELKQFLAENDYKNYCIRIHGFKNSAYSVGAMELGDLAFVMEKLTKESMAEQIPDMQEMLLEMYHSICTRYIELNQ